MKKKMNLVRTIILTLSIGIMLSGCTGKTGNAVSAEDPKKVERKANGQYLISPTLQIYDGDLKPIKVYFTYFPYAISSLRYDKGIIILNFPPPYIDAAVFIGKNDQFDSINLLRYCIDKSIEWAATVKQNNVSELSKLIPLDEIHGDKGLPYARASYGLNKPDFRNYDAAYLFFHFIVNEKWQDEKGPWLSLNYRSQKQLADSGPRGEYFFFHEKDFALLKEIFSESYLAEINKREEALQKSNAEKNEMFK